MGKWFIGRAYRHGGSDIGRPNTYCCRTGQHQGCWLSRLYEEEDQFMLGKDTLSSLGIGGGAMIASLEEGPATDLDGDYLTINRAAEVAVEVDSDILSLLTLMENTALLEEGEDCGLAHELYEFPVQHRVIW